MARGEKFSIHRFADLERRAAQVELIDDWRFRTRRRSASCRNGNTQSDSAGNGRKNCPHA